MFQLRCEKEVEIQAIQRNIKKDQLAPSLQALSSFSDSILPSRASFFWSSSSKKLDPYGINILRSRNFESRDNGFGTEIMPCADRYLHVHVPSMASLVVQPRNFSTTFLDDHITCVKDTSQKGSLDSSETRRVVSLEKLRQAQLTIQVRVSGLHYR